MLVIKFQFVPAKIVYHVTYDIFQVSNKGRTFRSEQTNEPANVRHSSVIGETRSTLTFDTFRIQEMRKSKKQIHTAEHRECCYFASDFAKFMLIIYRIYDQTIHFTDEKYAMKCALVEYEI